MNNFKKHLKKIQKFGLINHLRLTRRARNKHVIITQPIIEYVDGLTQRTFDGALTALWQESESMPMSNMQIDITEAAFLRFLAQMTDARHILEAGTFRGWSTAVLASALVKNQLANPKSGSEGESPEPVSPPQVITVQLREEEARQAELLWSKHLDAYTRSLIDMRMGNARIVMKDLSNHLAGFFDLIFIDAEKSGYEEYIGYAKVLVRKGGLIILDNMLNAGLAATSAKDNTTSAIRAANELAFSDEGVLEGFSPLIIPAWDGVVILRKE